VITRSGLPKDESVISGRQHRIAVGSRMQRKSSVLGFVAGATAILACSDLPACAQAGSTGGSIGKQGKSVSGGDAEPRARPPQPDRRRDEPKRKPRPQQVGPGAGAAVSVAGRWRWTADCQSGHWHGGWDLTETGGGQFTGSFAGLVFGDIGTISNGRVSGASMSFTRRAPFVTQIWTGQLSSGAKRIEGAITGNENCRFSAHK
jgi:hypothetical protein